MKVYTVYGEKTMVNFSNRKTAMNFAAKLLKKEGDIVSIKVREDSVEMMK